MNKHNLMVAGIAIVGLIAVMAVSPAVKAGVNNAADKLKGAVGA